MRPTEKREKKKMKHFHPRGKNAFQLSGPATAHGTCLKPSSVEILDILETHFSPKGIFRPPRPGRGFFFCKKIILFGFLELSKKGYQVFQVVPLTRLAFDDQRIPSNAQGDSNKVFQVFQPYVRHRNCTVYATGGGFLEKGACPVVQKRPAAIFFIRGARREAIAARKAPSPPTILYAGRSPGRLKQASCRTWSCPEASRVPGAPQSRM